MHCKLAAFAKTPLVIQNMTMSFETNRRLDGVASLEVFLRDHDAFPQLEHIGSRQRGAKQMLFFF